MTDEDRTKKNEVFGQKTRVDSDVPGVSVVESFKNDFGYEIPIESVPLPSNGKVYPEGSPLCDVESVEIRAMTAREEDILTSQALLKKGVVITELIKSCLVDKRIDPRELIAGDRNALMVAIRITGYGHEYDAEMECGECNVKNSRVFNLAELPIKRMEIEPVVPHMNMFQFVLPVSKKIINFKFLTGRDEEQITTLVEKQKKLGINSDNSVTTNLLYSIVSIDGNEDRNKISQFVRMMPARDSHSLRMFIKDNDPGIIMKQEVSCPACGHSEEVSIPFGVNFLWPSAGR